MNDFFVISLFRLTAQQFQNKNIQDSVQLPRLAFQTSHCLIDCTEYGNAIVYLILSFSKLVHKKRICRGSPSTQQSLISSKL